MSRSDRSLATSHSVASLPEPVGDSTSERVAHVVVKPLQRFDQQIVERKPDRAAPIRVSAEHPAGRFGRLVIELRRCTPSTSSIDRVIGVIARDRANPVRTQKGSRDRALL